MEAPNNETRQRILDVADELFSARGFASVRLRDIASALGLKHTAIYYYMPGGKEQLFVEVMERSLHRHRAGMEAAIAAAEPDLRTQLLDVAHWLLLQPPMNLARMTASDFPAISPDNAQKLSRLIFDSLRLPIVAALEQARARGVVDLPDLGLAAITFVTLVETIHGDNAPYLATLEEKQAVIVGLTDMLLNGWLAR